MNVQDFLRTSYTAYHAVDNCRRMLEAAGFVEMDANALPALRKGSKGYVVHGGTSIFAFAVGGEARLMLAQSHTDSPALRVKSAATIASAEGRRINVEKYGGLLLYSMLDIPLRVAGRVVVQTPTGIAQRLVVSPAQVSIPSLCVHHNPDNNHLTLEVQRDMLPLAGDVEDVYAWLAPDAKVLDADLFAVPDVAPYAAGAKGEYLCAPRIDNLTSVYASMEAITHVEPTGLAVAACYDNEEIGSGTYRGAGSAFLADLVESICRAAGYNNPKAVVSSGLALSTDNGHAVHPAHPEKSDPACQVVMGGGVVVKHHVNYATDGLSAGIFKRIMELAGIPCQDYYNHADVACGSTLGNIAARWLPMPTVDIGIAQLAMHSAVETASPEDVRTMQSAIEAAWRCTLRKVGDAVDVSL